MDNDARLRNYRAEEEQYLAIMRRSGSIKDTAEVAEKLGDVRGEIESLQAEQNYLSHQVEMAAIAVNLRTEAAVPANGFHWRPLYQAHLAFDSMLEGLAGYADAMLAFLLYLPVLIVWAATLLFGLLAAWRFLRWLQPRFAAASPKASGA